MENTEKIKSFLSHLVDITQSLKNKNNHPGSLLKLDVFVSLAGSSPLSWFLRNKTEADECEATTDVSGSMDQEYSTAYVELADALLDFGKVPEFKGREDIGFESRDFEHVSPCAVTSMACYDVVLQKLGCGANSVCCSDAESSKLFNSVINKWTVCALLLAVEHLTEQLWITFESHQASKKLIDTILKLQKATTRQELLLGSGSRSFESDHHGGYLGEVLKYIRPRMSRETWKTHPSVKCVYSWALLGIKSPCVSDCLEQVLSPALLLADDHEVQHKALGIRCLRHIMENVSASELRWYGLANVVYDALQRHTYSKEPLIIELVYPALLKSLQILEDPPKKATSIRIENKYDDIFDRLLTDMELENRIVLRRAYSGQLCPFIETMGVTVVRHFKRLHRVFSNYLEAYDGPNESTRANVLKGIYVTLRETWPRVTHHCDFFFKVILKFVIDILEDETSTPPKVKEELRNSAMENLVLLKRICPERCTLLLQTVQDCTLGKVPVGFLQDVLLAN